MYSTTFQRNDLITYLKSVSALKFCTGVNKYCLFTKPSNTAVSGVSQKIVLSGILEASTCLISQSAALTASFVPIFRSKGDGLPP